MDDYTFNICNNKHRGPILYIEGGFEVMRCSFCERIIKTAISPKKENESDKRSSNTCIQICDWVINDKKVSCNSCGYTGPAP